MTRKPTKPTNKSSTKSSKSVRGSKGPSNSSSVPGSTKTPGHSISAPDGGHSGGTQVWNRKSTTGQTPAKKAAATKAAARKSSGTKQYPNAASLADKVYRNVGAKHPVVADDELEAEISRRGLHQHDADLLLALAAMLERARDAGTPFMTDYDEPEALAKRVIATIPKRSRVGEATGPFYDTASLRERLGVKRQALDNRIKKGTILMCLTSDHQRVYPVWQFDAHGRVYPGIADVVQLFKSIGLDGWAIAQWLNTSNPDLGDRPASHLLAVGDTEPVIRAARRDADRLSH